MDVDKIPFELSKVYATMYEIIDTLPDDPREARDRLEAVVSIATQGQKDLDLVRQRAERLLGRQDPELAGGR